MLEQDYYNITIVDGRLEITVSRDDTEELPGVILDRLNEILQWVDSEWRVRPDPSDDECIILYQIEREKKDEK